MSDDDYWRDITSVSSAHEVQFNPQTGRYRHRPLSMGRLRQMDERRGLMDGCDVAVPDLEWKAGVP